MQPHRIDSHFGPAPIPAMLSTLCSYECLFGPYHPITLRLTIALGAAYAHNGDAREARYFLERAVADLDRVCGRDHESQRRALTILRELAERANDKTRTQAIDTELLACELLNVSAQGFPRTA